MPRRLHRYYGAGYPHFIHDQLLSATCTAGKKRNRDLFLEVLEQVRRRYRFAVIGYVVMPEHVHLLLSEPERRNSSVVMQALKQGFTRRLLRRIRTHDSRQSDLWTMALAESHIWAGWPILDGDLIFVGDDKREAAPSVAIFDGWGFVLPIPCSLIPSETSSDVVQIPDAQTAPSLLRCSAREMPNSSHKL